MTMTLPFEKVERASIPLWPHQRECLDRVHEARGRGITRQLVSMPTGSGKTILAAQLIAEVGLPAVMLVHRDELVRQSVNKIQAVNPDMSVGVVKAERDEIGADVVVASAMSLVSPRRLARLKAAKGERLLLISDEAHHDAARFRFAAINTLDPTLLVGLTATPSRADKIALGNLYQEIVYHLPMLSLIKAGKLANLRGLRIETEEDLDGVHTNRGEFAEDELADAVDTEGRNRLIVRAWQKHGEGRKRTVAFCVNKTHARHLTDTFREAGIRAECILAETPAAERVAMLDAFGRGEIPVLVNCMVLTEGFDEPGIDCVLMARPTKSTGLYIQCVGRAARTAPDKTDALVIDFVDNTSRHNLVSFPTLAGLDLPGEEKPTEKDRKVGEAVDLVELATEKAEGGRKLRERRAVEVNLFGASSYAWHTVGDRFMAPAGNGQWVTLIPSGDLYVPAKLMREGWESYLQPLFDRPLEADLAMSVAEAVVERNPLTAKTAGWRGRADPPTEKQLDIARRRRIPVPEGATKAQVSQLLDERFFLDALSRATPLAYRGGQ